MGYSSGDIIKLPRKGQEASVVILGVHNTLGQAVVLAQTYFKRLCKWDNVTDISTVKLFGHDLGPIDDEISQIALFETQGIEGPLLSSTNSFDLMDVQDKTEDSQESF